MYVYTIQWVGFGWLKIRSYRNQVFHHQILGSQCCRRQTSGESGKDKASLAINFYAYQAFVFLCNVVQPVRTRPQNARPFMYGENVDVQRCNQRHALFICLFQRQPTNVDNAPCCKWVREDHKGVYQNGQNWKRKNTPKQSKIEQQSSQRFQQTKSGSLREKPLAWEIIRTRKDKETGPDRPTHTRPCPPWWI